MKRVALMGDISTS